MEVYSIVLIGGGAIAAVALIATIKNNCRERKASEKMKSSPNNTRNLLINESCIKDADSIVEAEMSSLDKRPAKIAIEENLDVFAKLLPGIERGCIDVDLWKEAVINTNNEQLMLYWKSVIGTTDVATKWLKIVLEPCGIHYDDCLSFVSTSLYAERYCLNNGTSLIEGKTYNVISPCWLYSSFDENDVETIKVLHKGIVELKL